MDFDQASKHIWAAGYIPVLIGGMVRDYFYLVNRNNGLIIQSCFVQTTSIFPGNDSHTYARLDGLPGSGQYFITGDGEFAATDPLLVIDTADCHNEQHHVGQRLPIRPAAAAWRQRRDPQAIAAA